MSVAYVYFSFLMIIYINSYLYILLELITFNQKNKTVLYFKRDFVWEKKVFYKDIEGERQIKKKGGLREYKNAPLTS